MMPRVAACLGGLVAAAVVSLVVISLLTSVMSAISYDLVSGDLPPILLPNGLIGGLAGGLAGAWAALAADRELYGRTAFLVAVLGALAAWVVLVVLAGDFRTTSLIVVLGALAVIAGGVLGARMAVRRFA